MVVRSFAQKAERFCRFFQNIVLLGVVLSTINPNAYADRERSVSWTEMKELDHKTITRSQIASHGNLFNPAIPDSLLDSVIRDPGHEISSDFKIPAALKTSVRFWLSIYTQFSTHQTLIFDSNHMELVYEVVDLRPLAKAAKTKESFNQAVHQLIRRKLDSYRKAFASLADNAHPARPTREEKIVLKTVRRIKHPHSFQELSESLKAVRGQRDSMIKGLLAAETYLPKMEAVFSQMGVPKELSRLCLVESSFDLKALSRVGALGVWQFMPASGKKFLLIDPSQKIDERLSPLKATFAAGKLLLWNYEYLGDWTLAIISYNHGIRGLPRLSGQGTAFSKIARLFSSCQQESPLGWASRNYYSEFIAVLYAEAYRALFYGETPAPSLRTIAFRQLKKRQTGLSAAIEQGVSLEDFRHFNADILNLHSPLPKDFWIAVPGESDDIAGLVKHHLGPSKARALQISETNPAPKKTAKNI